MAARFSINLAQKASTDPLVQGLALTNELANQAFPETSHKRWTFALANQAGTVGSGATPLELFIDGVANFRLRPADTSTMMVEAVIVHTSSTASSSSVHTFRGVFMNRAGVTSLLADSTTVKMPSVVAASISVGVIANQVAFNCSGVGGDTNGRWNGRVTVTEVTDLG